MTSLRRHEFVLYAPEALAVTLDARRFATRIVPGPGGTWWEQVRLPAVASKDHLDVLFAPAYTAPLLRTVATVVAIHDLSFDAHPEWFGVREGIRRRWLSRQSAERAQAVITISEFSRRELIERFGVAESKIHVIPPGITPPAVTPPAADSHGSVLYVGSIFNRRHVPDLIRAFGPIARQHPQTSLDIVGDDRSVPREDLGSLIAHEGLTGVSAGASGWPTRSSARCTAGRGHSVFCPSTKGSGSRRSRRWRLAFRPSCWIRRWRARRAATAALFVRRGDIAATTLALERLLFDPATRASNPGSRAVGAGPIQLASRRARRHSR